MTATTAPCLIDSRPPGGTITRYAAAPGTTWWATYTVLVNPCESDAKLTGITFDGAQPGSNATWTGEARVRVLPEGAVANAILPGATDGGTQLAGYTLKSHQSVEVAARIKTGGATDVAHRVPVLKVAFDDAGGADELRLAPDLRLCACNPLG